MHCPEPGHGQARRLVVFPGGRCFDDRMLVERDALLASLDANLREAAGGSGRLVFVGGEAGVGKTTLIGALARDAHGVRILRGTVDGPAAAPLGPFLEALTAVSSVESLLEARDQLFPAVRCVLAEEPTLLVLEDLHWADEATLDLLGHLGRRLDGLPALIVGTFRDDEVTATHPLTVVLGDLATRRGVARMQVPTLTREGVRLLADDAGSHVEVAELYGRTCGNPFFVTEILAGDAASLPPSVRDAVLARAARLSPAARRVLDAAAVIGSAGELRLLSAVTGEAPESIDECFERGLLVPGSGGPRWEFRHELARQAVEDALPAAARARLHAATLARLSGSLDHRRLAYHAEASGDIDAVLVHAPLAGDRAARLGAHREAAAHYRTALGHGDALARSERAALLERLSYECYLTDQLWAAVDAQAEALQLHRAGDDPLRIGAAQRWLSRLSWFLGRNADAEQYAFDALQTLEPLERSAELAMAYSNLSQLHMLAGRNADAALCGHRAIELARALGDREIECHALNNVGTARADAGELADGLAEVQRSLDIALGIDAHEHVARAYTNLGSICVTHRRFAEADRTLRAGMVYCQDRDLESWRLYMSSWLAKLLTEQGRWDAAAQTAADVLRHPHVSPITRMPALTVSAVIAIRRGQPGADAALDEALALAQSTGEAQRVLPVMAARAEAAWTAGHRITAESTWAELLKHGTSWHVGELAWWARHAGIDQHVQRTCAEPFALMLESRTADAAAAWVRIGSPFWRAVALVESDRPADVRDGVEVLRSLGADATVRAVLRDLHAAGKPVPRGPRPASQADPAGLTARELDVLRLAAQGQDNAAIAVSLTLSVRTVERHLHNAYLKLGVRGKSARAAAVARLMARP